MVQWYNSRILILSTGVQSLSSSTRKRANKWLPEYNYQVLQILFLFHDLDFLFLLIHVLCHVFSLKQKGKREKRKDIALHTTVLSENKREKINKKAFCNTIFSRTILVIFFFFFSRTRRRAAHQYIKKIKRRERASRKTKNITGIEGL